MRTLQTLMLWILVASNSLAQESKDTSNYAISIALGINMSGELYGNFGDISSSLKLALERRISKSFRITVGIDFCNYRLQSDPYYKSHTSWSQTGSVTHVDTFLSVNHTRIKYYGVPVEFSFRNDALSFSPVFSIGVIPSFSNWKMDFEAQQAYPENISNVKIKNENGFVLFGVAEIGACYNRANWSYKLALTSNIPLVFREYFNHRPFSIGIDAGVYRRIRADKFPHKVGVLEEADRNRRKNYCYVEGLGSGLLYSINYERALIQKPKFGLNTRIGMSLLYMGEGSAYLQQKSTNLFPPSLDLYSYKSRFLLPHFIPFSISSSFGDVHRFEFGLGFTLHPIDYTGSGSFLFGQLGYRIETKSCYLFRITATPIFFVGDTSFIPWIGVSIGRRF